MLDPGHPELKVGALVWVQINGQLIFPAPVAIEKIYEHEGDQWFFVEGSATGLTAGNLTLAATSTLPLEPDRRQIEIFVDALFRHAGDNGFVSLRSIFETVDKPFRISHAKLSGGFQFLCDVAEDDARRAAQNPVPVVFCPPVAVFSNKDHAREEDILLGLALSVECDKGPQSARARLEVLLGPATVIVKSGGIWTNTETGEIEDKLHAHWRLKTPACSKNELARLKRARELAARIAGADASNVPVCHPIRWPGSWHRKAEPRLCEIGQVNDAEIDLDAALAILTTAAPASAKADGHDRQEPGGDAEDWANLVANVISGRVYHKSLVSLAARLAGAGLYDGQAVNLLRSIMQAVTAPHDERWQTRFDEIPRIISSAREKFAPAAELPEPLLTGQTGQGKDESAAPPFELFWHGKDHDDELCPWLVEELIPETGQGLASGQWGTAKTFGVLDLAASVMIATPFAGRKTVRQGGVLFIAAEGASQIPIRLKGLVEQKLRPQALALAAGGQPVAVNLDALPFAWIKDCPNLQNDEDFKRLVQTAKHAAQTIHERFDLPLALIIIDTVTAVGNFKDANDAAEGQRVMNRAGELGRQTGAFVLAVDHFGKAVETGTRGTSAKEADVVLALLADREINGTLSNTRMAVRKLRGGRVGEETPFKLRVVDVGEGKTTCIVEWEASRTPQAPAKDRWPKSLRIFKTALETAVIDHGKPIHPYGSEGAEVRAASYADVRAEFVAAYPADASDVKAKAHAKQVAFTRALKQARVERLTGSREIGGLDYLWVAATGG